MTPRSVGTSVRRTRGFWEGWGIIKGWGWKVVYRWTELEAETGKDTVGKKEEKVLSGGCGVARNQGSGGKGCM